MNSFSCAAATAKSVSLYVFKESQWPRKAHARQSSTKPGFQTSSLIAAATRWPLEVLLKCVYHCVCLFCFNLILPLPSTHDG